LWMICRSTLSCWVNDSYWLCSSATCEQECPPASEATTFALSLRALWAVGGMTFISALGVACGIVALGFTVSVGVAPEIVAPGFMVSARAATCGVVEVNAGWPDVVAMAGGVATAPSPVSKPTRALADASSGTVAAAAACEASTCCCNAATGCAAVCGVIAGEVPGAAPPLTCAAAPGAEPAVGNMGAD